MPLWMSGGTGLPGGGAPGQILGMTEAGETVWVDPAGGLFRGEWATDQVVKQYGFIEPQLPPEFTGSFGGNGSTPVLTTVASIDAASPPAGFTGAVDLPWVTLGTTATYSRLTLDLPALGIANITKVTAWFAQRNVSSASTYSQSKILRNGATSTSHPIGTHGWVKLSSAADSDDQIAFECRSTYNSNLNGYPNRHGLTAVEIHAAQAAPYMLSEFVTHEGRMWRSAVDNNAATPGVDASWVEALNLPAPAGTTAERPDAGVAGMGYPYFDTTLNKPIWSTGTSWVDATGTAV